MEETAQGEWIDVPPVGGQGGSCKADLIEFGDVSIWNRQAQLGKVSSSQTVFKLPFGSPLTWYCLGVARTNAYSNIFAIRMASGCFIVKNRSNLHVADRWNPHSFLGFQWVCVYPALSEFSLTPWLLNVGDQLSAILGCLGYRKSTPAGRSRLSIRKVTSWKN